MAAYEYIVRVCTTSQRRTRLCPRPSGFYVARVVAPRVGVMIAIVHLHAQRRAACMLAELDRVRVVTRRACR